MKAREKIDTVYLELFEDQENIIRYFICHETGWAIVEKAPIEPEKEIVYFTLAYNESFEGTSFEEAIKFLQNKFF